MRWDEREREGAIAEGRTDERTDERTDGRRTGGWGVYCAIASYRTRAACLPARPTNNAASCSPPPRVGLTHRARGAGRRRESAMDGAR